MWTAIGTAVLKGVVEHVFTPSNSAGSSNYKQDPPHNGYQQNQNQYYGAPQTAPRYHQTSTSQSNCHNCSKGSNKTKNNNRFPRNQKNDSFCTIKVQKNSDLEIKIKKSQSQMTNMNIKVQNNAQKAPLAGNKNLNGQKPRNTTTFNKDDNSNNKEKGVKSNKCGDNHLYNNVKPRHNQKLEPTSTGSTWMYLGRLKIGTTEGDIHAYLSAKFPGRKFKVESLPLYKDGKLPCFKVLVDDVILTEFQDLSHWPQGIKVTKYIHNFKM